MKKNLKKTNNVSSRCRTTKILGIVGISTSVIAVGLIVSVVALVFACINKNKAVLKQDIENVKLGYKLSIVGIIVGTIVAIGIGVGCFFIARNIWEHVIW